MFAFLFSFSWSASIGSISLLSSPSHGCLSLSTPLRACNSRSCFPVSLLPHVLLRLLSCFSCLSRRLSGGPCFDPADHYGSSSSLRSLSRSPLGPSPFSISTSFGLCSSSAQPQCWIFFYAPHNCFLKVSILPLFLFLQSLTTLFTLLQSVALILILHSLLCAIDLPASIPLHPGHPSVAPHSLMCDLVLYTLLTVGVRHGNCRASVPLLALPCWCVLIFSRFSMLCPVDLNWDVVRIPFF